MSEHNKQSEVPEKVLGNTDAYGFGLSPLHTRILNIFSKSVVIWNLDLQFNKNQRKELRRIKKKHIQDEFYKYGLITDHPKQGTENKSDGNTAPRFISDLK